MDTEPALILPALLDAIRDVPPSERDAAAVQLALRYAAALDKRPGDTELLADIGPKLLAALTALGMTVAGRGAKGGQANAAPNGSKLDELRARAQRRNGTG
jgi:hypothetical protein